MDFAFLIGRIIFGGYWLMAALNHFKNLNHMSEYAKAKGTPFPKLAAGGNGVLFLGGGLSVLLGVICRSELPSSSCSSWACRSRCTPSGR